MDLMSIGLSALRSASLGTQVQANNVANVNSKDYQAKRLDFQDQAGGGVRPGQLTASPDPTVPDGSNVDLATEFVALKVDSLTYKAGLKIVEAADDLLGQALDLKG